MLVDKAKRERNVLIELISFTFQLHEVVQGGGSVGGCEVVEGGNYRGGADCVWWALVVS